MTREPLAIRTAAVTAATAILHVLVVAGIIPISPDIETAAAAAIDVLGGLLVVLLVRPKVTPVADPRL